MYSDFIIEDGILKAYLGTDPVVNVPDGVTSIGGTISESDRDRSELVGDFIGYKAFYKNLYVKEVYLPDSVKIMGVKCFEHAYNLKVISIPSKIEYIDSNALLGPKFEKTIYRGTLEELDKIDFRQTGFETDIIVCTDYTLNMREEYYLEEYRFNGTREEWCREKANHWLNRRAKRIICNDD